MRQPLGLLVVLAAGLISGCYPGGGGGRYYSPRVILNSYDIKKYPFDGVPAELTNRLDIPMKLAVDDSDDRFIEGEKYYHFSKVLYNGETLTLAVPLDNWVAVIDEKGEVVATLETPRYSRYAVGVELSCPESEPYLAILIDQQRSSHSSTLYILDSHFEPIYEEHLLGAEWIGEVADSRGDILYVATEDKWLQKGEWETIGGKWRYDVCQANNGVQNGGKPGDLN